MKQGKHALVPGSFDPMTLGHYDLIRTVAERYERVTVAVMVNLEKHAQFDMETRVAIARLTLVDLPNVAVISDSGMLIDLFDRVGADVVCKGYRDETDYAYEQVQAEWNAAHNPHFRTELIPSNGEHAHVSSTMVREKLLRGESPEGLVADAALPLLYQKP